MMKGVVKAVLSGDTVVIMGLDSSRGPPPEKQLTLAHLSSPRVGNRTTPDAPFAWAARESLRAQLIGKEVSFSVAYANQSARQFGTVLLDGHQDVGLAVVRAGWARVQPPKAADGGGAAQAPAALEQLLAAEAEAKEAGAGMWTTVEGAAARHTRVIDHSPDVPALLKALQGQRVSAVVEHVNSASSFRLLLLPGYQVGARGARVGVRRALQSTPAVRPAQPARAPPLPLPPLRALQSVSLLLSGVMTPGIRRHPQTGAEEVQPFARESKFFAESRVLHRTVRVVLEGVDKGGSLVGSVLHVAHEINLAAELLRAGLGRLADWSLAMATGGPQLRQAEAAAKGARLNVWRGYTPPAAREGMAEYQARVVEVLGPDVLLVAPLGSEADERRVCLSAVRAPRPGYERRGEAGEPWAYEAKEWMRRAAIGKKVRVQPEYVRRLEAREAVAAAPGAASAPARPEAERTYAALFVGEKNLAAGLIGAGLAQVNAHARGEEVSAHLELLHDAERAAREKKVGMHSGKPPAGQPWGAGQDLSLPANKARAQAFLPALQRDSRVRATVLHVVHGARVKCLVPREGCVIGFSLAGVRCPATARRDVPGSASEPYAEEALAFTKGALLQRDIEIEVEGLDKNGTFLGAAYLPETKGSLGVALLEAGLASRIPPAADRSRHALELEAAERGARDARLKLWEGYEPQPAAEPEEAEAELPRAAADGSGPDAAAVRALLGRLPLADLRGTDVRDGATFYAQLCGPNDAAPREARRIEAALAGAAAVSAPSFSPKAGQACAAPFDGAYHRAKVVALLPGGKAEVFFVDYGNTAACALSETRPLDPAVSLAATSPLAQLCRLAYLVAPPTDDEPGTECALALSEAVLGRAVRARVEKRQGGEMAVTLLLAQPEGSGGSGSGAAAAAAAEAESPPPGSLPAAVVGTLNAQLVKEVRRSRADAPAPRPRPARAALALTPRPPRPRRRAGPRARRAPFGGAQRQQPARARRARAAAGRGQEGAVSNKRPARAAGALPPRRALLGSRRDAAARTTAHAPRCAARYPAPARASCGMWVHGDVEEDDCKEFGFTPRTESAWAKKK